MKQLINLKKTCPPGFIYLNIWFATFLIFSGCMAESTNISVTISRRRNKYNHLSSSPGVLNSREHKYQVTPGVLYSRAQISGLLYLGGDTIKISHLLRVYCIADSTNIRVTISRKRNNDLMKLKSMIFFCTPFHMYNLQFRV